tara:strand:- start:62 stop:385 length:324 start_codon:yes stop_codon:yes gene_type:complete
MLQYMIRDDGSLNINETNLRIVKKQDLLDYIRFLNDISKTIFLNDEIDDIDTFIKRIKQNKKIKIVHLINMYIQKIRNPVIITKNINGVSNTNLVDVLMKKTVNKIV